MDHQLITRGTNKVNFVKASYLDVVAAMNDVIQIAEAKIQFPQVAFVTGKNGKK